MLPLLPAALRHGREGIVRRTRVAGWHAAARGRADQASPSRLVSRFVMAGASDAVGPEWARLAGAPLLLQAAVALAVVAAALLRPFQAAVGVAGLVLPVLVEAGQHARLAGRLLGILGRDCPGEDGAGQEAALTLRTGHGLGAAAGRGAAFGLAELLPAHPAQGAAALGGLVGGAALLHGERRERRRGKACRNHQGAGADLEGTNLEPSHDVLSSPWWRGRVRREGARDGLGALSGLPREIGREGPDARERPCAPARLAPAQRGPIFAAAWRDGRVAEGARLESVYTGNRIVGSNPTPSASDLP